MRELEEKLEKQRKALLKKHADELKKQISEKGEERQQTKLNLFKQKEVMYIVCNIDSNYMEKFKKSNDLFKKGIVEY